MVQKDIWNAFWPGLPPLLPAEQFGNKTSSLRCCCFCFLWTDGFSLSKWLARTSLKWLATDPCALSMSDPTSFVSRAALSMIMWKQKCGCYGHVRDHIRGRIISLCSFPGTLGWNRWATDLDRRHSWDILMHRAWKCDARKLERHPRWMEKTEKKFLNNFQCGSLLGNTVVTAPWGQRKVPCNTLIMLHSINPCSAH